MAGTRWSKQCQTVPSLTYGHRQKYREQFSLQDLQLNEREFQTAGALTLKALADNVNDVRGAVSSSLSADLRQRPGL